jgi:hypothetical protein
MKVKLKIEKEFEVKYLFAKCGARYWEDATVNECEDTEGTLIPFRNGDYWEPLIELETGVIRNWPKGTTADIHYKVCDDGEYTLLNEDYEHIKTIEGYVPDIMCPEGDGYGDYVKMRIDQDGKIQNWKPNLEAFTTTEE